MSRNERSLSAELEALKEDLKVCQEVRGPFHFRRAECSERSFQGMSRSEMSLSGELKALREALKVSMSGSVRRTLETANECRHW